MTLAEAVEELRLLASYKATSGEWDEPAARGILEQFLNDSVAEVSDRRSPSVFHPCLSMVKNDRLQRIERIRRDFNNLRPRPI